MSELKNIPKEIYINVGDDEHCEIDFNFDDLTDVTWCTYAIDDNDIKYYLADDVDKHIKELDKKAWYRVKEENKRAIDAEQRNKDLKQRNKELEKALERSNYLLRGYKAQMHSFKLSEVIDEHIVTNEQLLKGKSDE